MLVSITKGKIGNMLWYTILFLHIALIPIYLGIWSVVPSYVQIFSNWIHLVVGLYLVIRFRPFQPKIDLYAHDINLVFSAGIFMLQALVASSLLVSPWGKSITFYLEEWRSRVLGLVGVFGMRKNKEALSYYPLSPTAKPSDAPISEPNPNEAVSSLGNSVYSSVGADASGDADAGGDVEESFDNFRK